MSCTKISVIIPVYNNQAQLEQCLASVVNQTLDDIEIIIINDCSSDSSATIISQFESCDSRIQTHIFTQNKGVSTARNTGIERASGQYIIFLDADDYWLDNTLLQTLYTRATSDHSDFVRFGFCRVSVDGKQSGYRSFSDTTIDTRKHTGWLITYSVWSLLISNKLVRDHSLQFHSELKMGEDALFSCELHCHAKRISICSTTGYAYRINPASINNSAWDFDKLFSTAKWFRLAIESIIKSPLIIHYPELLQQLIAERLQMLSNKLAPLAIGILDESAFENFINIWSDCFSYVDHDYFNNIVFKDPSTLIYKNILDHVLSGNMVNLKNTINSSSAAIGKSQRIESVSFSLDKAREIGKQLLAVNNESVKLDFGNGITKILSQARAHHLGRQLLNNDKPQITINFEP